MCVCVCVYLLCRSTLNTHSVLSRSAAVSATSETHCGSQLVPSLWQTHCGPPNTHTHTSTCTKTHSQTHTNTSVYVNFYIAVGKINNFCVKVLGFWVILLPYFYFLYFKCNFTNTQTVYNLYPYKDPYTHTLTHAHPYPYPDSTPNTKLSIKKEPMIMSGT